MQHDHTLKKLNFGLRGLDTGLRSKIKFYMFHIYEGCSICNENSPVYTKVLYLQIILILLHILRNTGGAILVTILLGHSIDRVVFA